MELTGFKKRLIAGLVLASLFEALLALIYCRAGPRPGDGEPVVLALFYVLFVLGALAVLGALFSLLFGSRLMGVSRHLWRNERERTTRDMPEFIEPEHQFSFWQTILSAFLPVFAVAASLLAIGLAIHCFRMKHPSPFELVETGSIEQVALLIDNFPVKLNAENEIGESLLIHAIRYGSPEMVDCLLARGADANVQNRQGWTPLHYAVQRQNELMVQRLLSSGAEPNVRCSEGNTPLLRALSIGFDGIELLLSNGASPRLCNALGETPLHVAMRENRPKAVDALLHAGANANVFSKQGWSPLHVAALHGSVDAADVLLKFVVDVDIANAHLQTPMHCAVKNARTTFMELLLQHGSRIDPQMVRDSVQAHRLAMNHTVDLKTNFAAQDSAANHEDFQIVSEEKTKVSDAADRPVKPALHLLNPPGE